MIKGALSEFRKFIADADAPELAVYLYDNFHDDKNASCFDNLAEFVVGHATEFPPGLSVDACDRDFVDTMRRAGTRRLLGFEAVPERRIIDIGPDLDFLEHTCLPSRLSALQVLCLAMHVRRPDRKGVAVVMMARDEGIYLPEWLAHYQPIGTDRIFIYTNDNSDGSDVLLRELAHAGLITLINNTLLKGVNPQRKAYQHAILLLDELRDYRWALFVDADEFLNFHTDEAGALPKFLSNIEQQFTTVLPGGWCSHGTGASQTAPSAETKSTCWNNIRTPACTTWSSL
jgi:hypothetical protein